MLFVHFLSTAIVMAFFPIMVTPFSFEGTHNLPIFWFTHGITPVTRSLHHQFLVHTPHSIIHLYGCSDCFSHNELHKSKSGVAQLPSLGRDDYIDDPSTLVEKLFQPFRIHLIRVLIYKD
ncbi:hypothetical protein U1Q18_027728 [Sarracenia purpurea var. burkii]